MKSNEDKGCMSFHCTLEEAKTMCSFFEDKLQSCHPEKLLDLEGRPFSLEVTGDELATVEVDYWFLKNYLTEEEVKILNG